MNIVFIASGKSFHACRWANALVARGACVHFISAVPFTQPLSSNVVQYQLNNFPGATKYVFNLFSARAIIKSINPDFVHAHYSSGNGLLARLSLLNLDYPFITSLYGAEVFDFPFKSKLHKLTLKFIVNRADRILSTSEVMADKFSSVYPMFSRPYVTPFGVDTSLFTPSLEARTVSTFTIGLVKKLEDKYGIDILLRAFAKLIHEHKLSCTLMIAGGGSKEFVLKSLAKELNVESNVNFIGWINNSDVPKFMNQLDVFVVPSRFQSESFGVAAVEAMSCGVPVIVSDVGGLPEVVSHMKSGLVFKSESISELVTSILLMINSPKMTLNMKDSARKRVLELYDWNDSVNLMVDIYTPFIKKD